MGNLEAAGIFLIRTLFDFYLFILSIRLILVWTHASVFNSFTQVILKLTEPIIKWLRRILPTVKRFECSTFFLMIILEAIELTLITLLFYDSVPPFSLLVLLTLSGVIRTILNTFFFAILFMAILSWIRPEPSPIMTVLAQLSAPIMRPLRRIIPLISGIDITPIPALIILQVLIIALKD